MYTINTTVKSIMCHHHYYDFRPINKRRYIYICAIKFVMLRRLCFFSDVNALVTTLSLLLIAYHISKRS